MIASMYFTFNKTKVTVAHHVSIIWNILTAPFQNVSAATIKITLHSPVCATFHFKLNFGFSIVQVSLRMVLGREAKVAPTIHQHFHVHNYLFPQPLPRTRVHSDSLRLILCGSSKSAPIDGGFLTPFFFLLCFCAFVCCFERLSRFAGCMSLNEGIPCDS